LPTTAGATRKEDQVKSFLRICGGLAVTVSLAACSDPAGLGTRKEGAVLNAVEGPSVGQTTTANDGLITVAPQGPLGNTQPWTQPFGPNAIRIHGNLGDGSNVYDCCIGLTVAGRASIVGRSAVTANAFEPGDNYTVTGIALALTHAAAPNIYNVSLNADNAGVPGAVLREWTVTNLAWFGTCCGVVVVRSWSALPITQGTRYWVVASTESHNTLGAWNLNSRGAVGPVAQQVDGTWVPFGYVQGALAVYGKLN